MKVSNCLDKFIGKLLYEDFIMGIYYNQYRQKHETYDEFRKELNKHYNFEVISHHIAVGNGYKINKI